MSSTELKYIKGEITANQYLEITLKKYDLSEITNGCDNLAQEICSTIKAGFWKLDKLDRNDPFWTPGNGLPTITKLDEYSRHQIKHRKEMNYWSWINICISYLYFSNFLYPTLWKSLDKVNVTWLVRTSWNYYDYSGSENSIELAKIIKTLSLENEASSELINLSRLHPESKNWAKNVNMCISQLR